jgi:hypothetical protein
MFALKLLIVLGSLSSATSVSPAGRQPPGALVEILRTLDARQNGTGDYRRLVYIEQKRPKKSDVIFEAVLFRRDRTGHFLMLFTKPKASEGQGYLLVEKNLWFYDPKVGRWERRTERERIAGTNSRRADFGESRLALDYQPEDLGQETLGRYRAQVMLLSGKPELDLAFPRIKLWVDRESRNVLKRQEFALSGRLLRTSYYPRWKSAYSDEKKGEVWYPEEMRFFDEVERDNVTTVLTRSVDFTPIEENVFTKAWLESKSR